ncbi:hypothetical protein PGT21_021219 [Puccinia graminis f. sp. tritici]|uniref:Uncharacterized protein n=1 Tax=Puccinia graminis f. sp. tritici TaxID=56615 RepID=A0A5B0NJR1_PUCGR|nr:hypothetical protein PGT21_021219 [Puccinia graminis f. sp. tritici]
MTQQSLNIKSLVSTSSSSTVHTSSDLTPTFKMPRGIKHPHPGNPGTIASSTTKAASSSPSGRNSESDVKILQDPPSTGPTPTPWN